jgi:uncharacterized protein
MLLHGRGRMETEVKLDYPRIVQDAFRDVVRRVLAQVAEHGLPGEHHFYIGFRTDRPGVELPPHLRDQYPEEMTVILQHQYWDLAVDEEAFSVSLNFNAHRHRVRVPFSALTAFVDPSSEFGLRFDGGGGAGAPADEPEEESAASPPQGTPGKPGEVVPFAPRRRK